MNGLFTLRRMVSTRSRSVRRISPALALAALAVCTLPGAATAGLSSRGPAAAVEPVQYAQATGYVGDAPARNPGAPAAAEPAPPGPGGHQKPSKPHEKKVGYVMVHPEDPKDDEKIYLDFKSVSKALNLDRHDGERSDVKEHFRALKGSKVEWSGMVYRVKVGRRGYEIQVKNHSAPTDGTYNIVLKGDEREEAQDVDNDDEIWFTGEIADFKPGRGERGAIVVLADGDIEKKKSR